MTMEMFFQEISLYFIAEASNIESAAHSRNMSLIASHQQRLMNHVLQLQTISLEEVKSQKFSIFQISFQNMLYKAAQITRGSLQTLTSMTGRNFNTNTLHSSLQILQKEQRRIIRSIGSFPTFPSRRSKLPCQNQEHPL